MKQNYTKLYMVLALLTLFALSACGKSNNNESNTPSPSAPEGGGATKEITENAVNWSFSEPEIKANVGDTLKLTLNNQTGVHGLQIEDLGVNLKNGETATIKLDKAGTYEFHCSIQCGQGHDNMVGQIIVE
ncbi:cupredoxin domain-containing protein [Paenibacillus sp. PR3]|uniref:Cupredoxin domain-containing protein n=1 Tax=Paenibacillus terricola TaxID=2763503 RepID=A0ABR8MXX5_9BACL|nr:cupredoxin domain-containing protein [Paenibacillus terricola]MBD3919039.1 cupredoxin domain-containing protein [Paenibacillus terricola]